MSVGAARVAQGTAERVLYRFHRTPISTDDRKPARSSGDYIDVYDMTQSVEDESTRRSTTKAVVVSPILTRTRWAASTRSTRSSRTSRRGERGEIQA
ncbi:MAG: hypothetical protein ACLSUZ_01875 [Bifidobacterium pseudocatenulatum]